MNFHRAALIYPCLALPIAAFAERTIEVQLAPGMATVAAVGNLKQGFCNFRETTYFLGEHVKSPFSYKVKVRKHDLVVVTNWEGNLAKRDESLIKNRWVPKPSDFKF